MLKQLGVVPGVVDQLLGAPHRLPLADGQVFVAHVGPDRLARPVQQRLEAGSYRLGEAGEQGVAIPLIEPAQDGQQLAPRHGPLQQADEAGMQAQQQPGRAVGRERPEQGGPLRHGQGIEDAVELFRTQGQQLIGARHRIQVVGQPALQGGQIEQLMTIE
ncbi:hypothetical protein D3C78_1315180 [compost metagenome]